MAKVLTERAVETLKPDATKRREIPDGGLPGLYLVVQPSGAKSWAARYRHNGRTRKLTIGRYPLLGLKDARDKAREALVAVDTGTDPAAEKKARRENANTVSGLIDYFMERHGSKLKSGGETRRIFDREVIPAWGDRRPESITRRDVLDLLDGIVDRGAPYMANRVLAAVRKLFNWAVARDSLVASPVAGVKPPAPEKSRERVLNDDEIRAFWAATDAMSFPFGPLFRLLLLSGQRRDEVAAMTWSEVSGSDWQIPAERTKNKEPHRVHLSGPALIALAKCPRRGDSDFVFTTNGKTHVSGYSRAKTTLDRLVA